MVKRVTIKDVATEAGVSVTSVSIVLNGKGMSVPLSTRERIFAAAEKLHYTPNYTARSLVMGKTNMVGIIVPSITNSFFAELVRLLQNQFAKYGYDIVLSNNEDSAENDLKYIRLLSGRNIDGLIFTPSSESLYEDKTEKLRKTIDKLSIPCLFLDRYFGDYPHISVDNTSSSYALADYLVRRGHKKIGVVTGPMRLNSSANRLKGLQKRLLEEGIELPDSYVYEGNYDIETGEKAAARFLQTDVTAIFAFSDMQAYGVYKKLKELGKKVPEDISVVGFDDNVYSALLDKPLTTMRQPLEEIATATVKTMLEMMRGKGYEKTDKIPATLIERESVKQL